MDFDFAVIGTKLELLLWTEVLIAKEDHAAFGDEQGKLVSLLVCEVFQLEANNLGADVAGQVLDFFCSREEGFLGRVCSGASVNVLAAMVSYCVDVLQVKRDCRAVLYSSQQEFF